MSRLTFNFVSPLIERHFENASDTLFSRKHDALVVCDALKKWSEVVENEYLLEDFYTSLFRIINSRYGARLLLYLPFDVMKHIPNHFKEDYLDAWYGLLRVQDVRENFHLGDIFEESARPSGEMDRVIKCVHLLPWMMVCGLISCDEISSVISGHKNSLVFLQSYYDVLSVLKIWVKMVVDESEMENALKKISMPGVFIPKARTTPLFNSEKRLAWLAEMQREDFEMVTPNAHLEGPFWPNVAKFLPDLYKCAERLDDNKILMIGGSKIKGYGTVDSDVDVWDFQDFIDENAWGKKALEEASDSSVLDGTLSPNDTNIFFNSVWISKRPREEMLTLADDIFRAYAVNCPELVRRYALERLEGDLLQYRLLHKGFARFSGRRSYKVLAQGMDGDCPFYDDEYRKVATMIYAKYIWF